MKYSLDTNACVRYLTGRSDVLRQRIEAVEPGDIIVCSVVRAELFFGAAKSVSPQKTREAQQRFLSRFQSLPFDDLAAEIYGVIRASLERSGVGIGANDLLIAAIALAHGLTVVTNNVSEFSRVPGLQLEDWERRNNPSQKH